jgi:hypothetical protein
VIETIHRTVFRIRCEGGSLSVSYDKEGLRTVRIQAADSEDVVYLDLTEEQLSDWISVLASALNMIRAKEG